LNHDISFDILDIEAPFGDSALKLLFPKKFSTLSSLEHEGTTYEATKPYFSFKIAISCFRVRDSLT
jgi:hypothetical protein